jgi:outer membrane autotransporter protein
MFKLRSTVAVAAVAAGLLLPSAASAAPAVFFNDDLDAGRATLLNAITLSDQAFNAANPSLPPRVSPVFEIDITNSLTDSNGVFSVVNGSTTVWVRTTQGGGIARNNQNGDLGGDGFTNWSNVYSGGFAGAEALGYTLSFFADAALTTPFEMNALGLHVNDWGTCCTSGNPTPLGGTANASEIYLRFFTGSSDSLLLLGGISSPIPGIEHFIGAVNDTNFFNSVRVIATGNGEFFGAGGRLIFSGVALNSTPPGLSVISGGGLIGGTVRNYWDGAGPAGDGIVQGGTGTWTATSANFTDQAGTASGSYSPVPTTVIFGGTGGTVTVDDVDGPISITGMTFDVNGYTVTGDDIALAGPTATFTVNGAGNTAVITNNFTGTAAIVKAGTGTSVLTGNAGGAVVQLDAGTLAGTPTIGGLTAASGTIVSPGTVAAPIGTITSNGNASFATGSRYNVNLAANGTGDRITVDGTGTVAAGTTLGVTRTGTTPLVLGTRYTVLSTTGGRTGSFATLTGDTRVSQFVSVVQETDANNIYLGVRQTSSFASAAGTPNQRAAATGADATGNGALYNAIAYLPDAAAARAAFDQISGEIHSTARGQTVQDSRFVREALSARMQAPGEERKALWVSGYGSWGNTGGDGNAAKVNRDIGGFFVGVETDVGDDASVGILAGYGTATIKVNDRASSARTDDIHVGGYGSFRSGKAYGHLAVAHMWRNLDTNRSVSFPGFSDALTASYRTNLTQVFGELGVQLATADKAALSPFAQLAYIDVSTNAISETGGAARLNSVGKTGGNFLVTTLGARVQYGLPVGSGKFGITGEAGWRHIANGNERTPINFTLPAGPAFSIQGVPFGRDVAALGLVLSGEVRSNVMIDFGYRGQIGSGVEDHGVRGGVIVRF